MRPPERPGEFPQELDGAELAAVAPDSVTEERERSIKSEVAKAMVGLHKKYYGKGPERAKTYLLDDYVLVVMEGGLTANEETLIAAGKEDLVRAYRLEFQATMAPTALGAFTDLIGRKVLDYHSQIVFHPPRIFEIMVLEPEET